MINHVNTVLVSNSKTATTIQNLDGFDKAADAVALRGQYIVYDPDTNAYAIDPTTRRFKIGMADGTYSLKFNKRTGEKKFIPNIRWSNTIQVNAIQSISELKYAENKAEKIHIEFDDQEIKNLFAQHDGNVSITLRIQYKDMPTRYRQWSESYNYLADGTEDAAKLVKEFVKLINAESKRQRVYATANGTTLELEGMPYSDPKIYDLAYENTVRFNAVMYFQLPQADGITFNNKYNMPVTIKKEEAERYPADALIVRSREIESWDYMGVLHRCCWFDPTPHVMTNLDGKYNGLTIEFENEYHAADDIRRHTKESVELYADKDNAVLDNLKTAIEAAIKTDDSKFVTKEDKQLPEAAVAASSTEG